MKNKGLLFILSGPSGAGKGTVVKELVKLPENEVSVSVTTREPREGEIDGVHYHFFTVDKFRKLIDENGFLEYAQYCENYYGTPLAQIEKWLSEAKNVILEIDVQGCRQVKVKRPDAITLFIAPPSMEVLEHRLRKRGTEDEETIQKRLNTAKSEMQKAGEYDYVVINGPIEECVEDVLAIFKAENIKAQNAESINI
ncbi:guanylate kinase [Pseudoruminococcus massiliensis]|uniref:guanylate kinase n=1 Tax=Pseudoruminococcus massiliensis TaxID=2086583 RepID=UPI003AB22FE9